MLRRRAHIAMVGSKQLQAAARAEDGTPRAADLIENMPAAAASPAL
ncbi:hypothetical protein [Streptomyces griseus]|nr:hypothetical protein [Streptomyces griseus]